jgi:hypothetical protein
MFLANGKSTESIHGLLLGAPFVDTLSTGVMVTKDRKQIALLTRENSHSVL